ncbi:MAG: DUF4230 domain-containing protein [Bacteroidota bacterium]
MAETEKRGGISTSQGIIVILILAIMATLAYKYYRNQPGSFLAAPQEYQLQYKPVDFELKVDTETALAILQNPKRYRREFDKMVYDINTDILDHVSNRLGLNDSLHRSVIREYDEEHPQFADLYFNDFLRIRDTTAQLYETWYEEGGRKVTEVFEEVAAKYTCFLVNKILASVIRTRNGNILAKGSDVTTPCGIAMGEALTPLIQRMQERAAIDDFSRSKGIFQEKVERFIGELATVEIRDKKGISKSMQTNIWGINVSNTDVEITAISILKVGFRMQEYFDIQLDGRNKLVNITLPEPTILSHEVLPKIEKLDIGWMRELENKSINEGINSLRETFRAEAIESNVMDRAKKQAEELMNTMFTPVVQSIGDNYRIKLNYRGVPLEPEEANLEIE